MFDEETGARMLMRDDKTPIPRFIHMGGEYLPPCRQPKGCAKGTPEKTVGLWPENVMCYEHYLECKAVGQFPDDAVIKRNAAVIRDVEEAAELKRGTDRHVNLVKLMAVR